MECQIPRSHLGQLFCSVIVHSHTGRCSVFLVVHKSIHLQFNWKTSLSTDEGYCHYCLRVVEVDPLAALI